MSHINVWHFDTSHIDIRHCWYVTLWYLSLWDSLKMSDIYVGHAQDTRHWVEYTKNVRHWAGHTNNVRQWCGTYQQCQTLMWDMSRIPDINVGHVKNIMMWDMQTMSDTEWDMLRMSAINVGHVNKVRPLSRTCQEYQTLIGTYQQCLILMWNTLTMSDH